MLRSHRRRSVLLIVCVGSALCPVKLQNLRLCYERRSFGISVLVEETTLLDLVKNSCRNSRSFATLHCSTATKDTHKSSILAILFQLPHNYCCRYDEQGEREHNPGEWDFHFSTHLIVQLSKTTFYQHFHYMYIIQTQRLEKSIFGRSCVTCRSLQW